MLRYVGTRLATVEDVYPSGKMVLFGYDFQLRNDESMRPAFGGPKSGFHYCPRLTVPAPPGQGTGQVLGDVVAIAQGHDNLPVAVGYFLSSNPADGVGMYPLLPGESAALWLSADGTKQNVVKLAADGSMAWAHNTGASITITALGDVQIVAAAGRTVYVGATDGTAQPAAREGDQVSASGSVGSGGGSFTATGPITGGSSKVKIG